VVATIGEVLAAVGGVIAIDIPIGLPTAGPRACDREARALVGPRRSSVFPAPSRSSLSAVTFAETTGLSIQSWNLIPKIREVDAAWEPRMVEAFPELVFAVLAGAPMTHSKRTAEGHAERLATLGMSAAPRLKGAAADDVLDAIACLRAAHREAAGTALSLGDGTTDARGRPMRIIA
jgi:predicted RNase H-like nuclease